MSTEKEIKELENGKILVIKNKELECCPLYCPLCCCSMRSQDDSIAFRQSGVCYFCELHWGYDKRYDLKKGFFPPKDTQAWKDYMELKKSSMRTIFNLK